MAITNCLNFGNPRRPEVYYQLREAIAGIADACTALGTPVTGGNVSLYNESPAGAVYPTPVIGMVGVHATLAHITRSTFRDAGDSIVLFGEPTDEIGGSEYLARVHGVVAGPPPRCDPSRERALIDALLDAIGAGWVQSAHDCSDGGLAVAIAECAIMDLERPVGADVDLGAWSVLPMRALLFGEAQGRIVISTATPAPVIETAIRHGVPARAIGRVTAGDTLTILAGPRRIHSRLDRLRAAYHNAIATVMSRAAAAAPAPLLSGP
jgi:phosphoribosylformylglycinamidine synthase